jgi:hypothetical protein
MNKHTLFASREQEVSPLIDEAFAIGISSYNYANFARPLQVSDRANACCVQRIVDDFHGIGTSLRRGPCPLLTTLGYFSPADESYC